MPCTRPADPRPSSRGRGGRAFHAVPAVGGLTVVRLVREPASSMPTDTPPPVAGNAPSSHEAPSTDPNPVPPPASEGRPRIGRGRAGPGRTPKLPDPDTEAAILMALRAGSTRGIASEHAGVAERVLREYLNVDSKELDPDGKPTPRARKAQAFGLEVRKAEAGAAAGMVAHVMKAAQNGDARAAQWWLARRHPKDFGERIGIELKVAGEREAMLDVLKARLPDELYREVLGDLASRDTVGDDDTGGT